MLSINIVASIKTPSASIGFQIENGIVNSLNSSPEKSAKGIVYSTKPSVSSVPV